MSTRFIIRTGLPVPPSEAFDLAADIDAHVASMSKSAERAVAGVTSGRIGLGESVTWRARHFGLWFTLTVRITTLVRPERFVDEQTHGPFRAFRHEHLFVADGRGGTVMTDIVDVSSPVFGALAEKLILVPYLRRLLAQRNRQLAAAPGAEERGK